ncbi:substrate-binding periplasmic protein [Arthrobacter sp. D2-10]
MALTKHGRATRIGAALTAFAAAITLLTGCAGAQAGDDEAASKYNLIGGDKVLINTTASMPNTNLVNGEFVGFEAEMLTTALDDLGLESQVVISDFPGMLAAVQSSRQDIAVGSVAWRKERTQKGLFTDPPFYVPHVYLHSPEVSASTHHDLAGKRVGTITGFLFVDNLQKRDDVDLHTYPDAATVIADLQAGRIDVALIDPLMAIYTAQSRPELDLVATPIVAPTIDELRADPTLEIFGPVMLGWYLAPGHEELQAALDEQIRKMYADGQIAELMTKYGIENPDEFLSLSDGWAQVFSEQRTAVDREAGWTPPEK